MAREKKSHHFIDFKSSYSFGMEKNAVNGMWRQLKNQIKFLHTKNVPISVYDGIP